jgi:polysaccharide deacetylase family protein (PEP-CTERM system associated)
LKLTIVSAMKNALSIDLEEYFQIHALAGLIQPDMWPDFPSSIEDNTVRILDLLEEFRIKTTFFCLGWIAEHHRGLIKRIHRQGHEIACHGFAHQVIYQQDKVVFRNDVSKAKDILEDVIGEPVRGYRAPTYSITKKTLWALSILEELGFRYDSSIFPIYHDTYGMPHAPRFPYRLPDSSLVEFPISTLKLGPINFPISGGGYFRLLPYFFTKIALKALMHSNNPFVFYIHPWELNADTPRVAGMDVRSRFRTYVGIGTSFQRFTTLLQDFSFAPIRDVLIEMGLLF